MSNLRTLFSLFLMFGLGFASCKNKNSHVVTTQVHEIVKITGDDFCKAALDGNVDLVRKALESGVDVDFADSDGRTALMYASFNGHTDVIKTLLARGAKVDMRDPNGRTALILAASGPFPAALNLLLDAGSDPNLFDREERFTALMYAAAEGHLDNVKMLISYKADPLMKDTDGDYALVFARNNGHTEVVNYLSKFVK
ncbi:MAG TPA: ankyrin repeat domain-containing protein [Bacteroidales bacterium]|nr:ankyrin repeat domain-containing protein [Bacteroidales bacterium]